MLMTHCFVYSLFPFFQRVPRDHHVFPLDPLLRERFVRGLLLLSSFRSIHGRCYNLTLIPPSSRLNGRSENIFFLHAYQTTVPLSVNTKWMQPSPKPWPYNPPRAPKGNESKKNEPCYVMLTLCTNPQRSLRYKNYWYAKKYLLKCKWFPREITSKRNRKIVFRFSLVNGKGLTHNYSRARVSWLRGVRYNRYSRAIVRFRLSTSRIRPNFPNDPALFIIIRRRITWQ